MPVVTFSTTGVFSGYTMDNLRAQTLRRLRASDTTRYSPTKGAADYDWIDDALNRGQEDFVRATNCLRSYAIIQLEANRRTHRLPEDCIDIMAAYFYHSSLTNGYKELTIKTIEELNDDVPDWRTDSGTPERLYIDRQYGAGTLFGLNPIPDTDGETVTIDSNYGVTTSYENHSFNSDYGVVIAASGDTDINPAVGAVISVLIADGNVLIEYYRLPHTMTYVVGTDVYPEIAREYQKALPKYAAADLLSDNPEDSVEFKRSAALMASFQGEIEMYKNRRKRPLSGRNLQARAMVWGWNAAMPYRKEMR